MQLNKTLIECMQEKDIPMVLEIENQVHEYPWSERIFYDCLKAGYQGYIIRNEETQQVMCFSLFSFAADECHLLNIATASAYQRQGLAKTLLRFCLSLYKEKKSASCYLEVRESNWTALQMYEDLGFHLSGIRRDYYPSPQGRENAIIMTLNLLEDSSSSENHVK